MALSDRSFSGISPEAVFEQARRAGIPRLVMHDAGLRPIRRWRLRLLKRQDPEEWRGVSRWAEALDYSRQRLHAMRFERLRAGVRLVAWAIAPRAPDEAGASRIPQYALTAATAAAFLGAQGLLLEGMDSWEPGEALAFIRRLLPALGGLRRTLWVRLPGASPLLSGILRTFRATIRPWIALDLEEMLPEDFPTLWDMIRPSVSMIMLRCDGGLLDWWDREGCPILERTAFQGELVVTFPEVVGDLRKAWRRLAQAHRLLPEPCDPLP